MWCMHAHPLSLTKHLGKQNCVVPSSQLFGRGVSWTSPKPFWNGQLLIVVAAFLLCSTPCLSPSSPSSRGKILCWSFLFQGSLFPGPKLGPAWLSLLMFTKEDRAVLVSAHPPYLAITLLQRFPCPAIEAAQEWNKELCGSQMGSWFFPHWSLKILF